MKLPVSRLLTQAHALQGTHTAGLAGPRSRRHTRLAMSADSDNSAEDFNVRLAGRAAAITVAAAIALTPLASEAASPELIPYSSLVSEITTHKIAELSFANDEKSVILKTLDGAVQTASVLPTAQTKLVDLLLSNDVPFSVQQAPQTPLLAQAFGVLLNLAFPLFLLASFILPRIGGGGGPGGAPGGGMNPFEIGKSKATLEMEPSTGVKFADVAGCDGSKLELAEVVEFLTNPGKYEKLGAKAPRGVIMEGPPGTGKTLLARAVAGEAGVPFISASGSEFVEMFVGVGASRVRDIFTKAKKNSPCIIFIDEIDAIGKKRNGGGGRPSGGGNDEQEQTLNQILTEMDGFSGNSGVVVIAATNRADVLDDALLRPGRFDRRVPVDLPDRQGREAILGVHARSKPLDSSVDLKMIAARTTGFSGASLANLLNEAAIVAARRDREEISINEIEYALDRLTVGLEKRTGMADGKRQELVAYHEAGHALMAALTPGFDEVGKITIVPRSNGAGGFTLFLPSDEQQDSGMYTRSYLEGRLKVALGGRVAEELAYGKEEITTGASSDLQSVASLARRMVTQWGFASDVLGSTAWEGPNGSGFNQPQMASEETQKRIDVEVEKIVNKAYDDCFAALSSNRGLLDELTTTLMREETIGNDELKQLVKDYNAGGEGKATKESLQYEMMALNQDIAKAAAEKAALQATADETAEGTVSAVAEE
eukprot:CAMPEP_0119479434 /NCGR_PEP_ID=MMETSP1344-20130328/8700_1 /TAXON_ID=236787 /ORGANISM="Florenciella parvula, Strain CCMP2471" /LENGTH=711 /DNA_ID=CAMNT_0007513667 /DNA_START=86 /DNA_END=2221 /DNA_ORIENTATION=-